MECGSFPVGPADGRADGTHPGTQLVSRRHSRPGSLLRNPRLARTSLPNDSVRWKYSHRDLKRQLSGPVGFGSLAWDFFQRKCSGFLQPVVGCHWCVLFIAIMLGLAVMGVQDVILSICWS